MVNVTEQQAARLLLNKGVRVPITAPLLFRLIGIKKWKFTITSPTAYQLIRIAEYFLQIDVKAEEEFDANQALELYHKYGLTMAKITAVGLLNSRAKEWQVNLLARHLTKHLVADEMIWVYRLLVLHSGVRDFTNTIKSVGKTRLTKPMNLSPQEEMS